MKLNTLPTQCLYSSLMKQVSGMLLKLASLPGTPGNSYLRIFLAGWLNQVRTLFCQSLWKWGFRIIPFRLGAMAAYFPATQHGTGTWADCHAGTQLHLDKLTRLLAILIDKPRYRDATCRNLPSVLFRNTSRMLICIVRHINKMYCYKKWSLTAMLTHKHHLTEQRH